MNFSWLNNRTQVYEIYLVKLSLKTVLIFALNIEKSSKLFKFKNKKQEK